MIAQDGNSSVCPGAEHSDQINVALVSKYAPGGIGGIESHPEMLLKHVQTPSCACIPVMSGGACESLRFIQRLMRCRGELVHFHGFDRLQLLMLMLFVRRRIPLVVTPHNGVHGAVDDRNAVRRLLKRWADGVLFPGLIRQRARVIALTVEERDYYLTRFPGCGHLLEVLPNPVEAHRQAPLLPAPAPVRLLALARLDPCKHIEDLVSAMALLPPDVECDIGGPECGAAAALHDQARQVERTIRFYGAVRGARRSDYSTRRPLSWFPHKPRDYQPCLGSACARDTGGCVRLRLARPAGRGRVPVPISFSRRSCSDDRISVGGREPCRGTACGTACLG